eukprot:scaffold10632_cov33-Phaeocystis_antarctica.AAC.1
MRKGTTHPPSSSPLPQLWSWSWSWSWSSSHGESDAARAAGAPRGGALRGDARRLEDADELPAAAATVGARMEVEAAEGRMEAEAAGARMDVEAAGAQMEAASDAIRACVDLGATLRGSSSAAAAACSR